MRPRIGDFLYSEEEVDVMLEDIRIFKQRNVRGFVVGALSKDGRVNAEVMKRCDPYLVPTFIKHTHIFLLSDLSTKFYLSKV